MTATLTPKGATIAAAVAGAAGWIAIAIGSGRSEAWDANLYFTAFFPLLAILVGALAFLAPARPAGIAFASVGGQAAVATMQNPTGGLLPLGLIVFGIFGTLYLIPAYGGTWLRRKIDPESPA